MRRTGHERDNRHSSSGHRIAPNCNNFDLTVSHGIFSKGKDILYDAGYNNIYTTNSLLSNTEEFRIF